jgi:hypothetical protein
MREWWSTQIFRVVMFFLFCFGVFGVATAMTFQEVMSIDQYLERGVGETSQRDS